MKKQQKTDVKWSEFIINLYVKIKENGRFNLTDFVREKKVSGALIVVLKKNKFIKNYGSSKKPNWKWVRDFPSENISLRIISETRSYNKEKSDKFNSDKKDLTLFKTDTEKQIILNRLKQKSINRKLKNIKIENPKKEYEVKLCFGLIKLTIKQK